MEKRMNKWTQLLGWIDKINMADLKEEVFSSKFLKVRCDFSLDPQAVGMPNFKRCKLDSYKLASFKAFCNYLTSLAFC